MTRLADACDRSHSAGRFPDLVKGHLGIIRLVCISGAAMFLLGACGATAKVTPSRPTSSSSTTSAPASVPSPSAPTSSPPAASSSPPAASPPANSSSPSIASSTTTPPGSSPPPAECGTSTLSASQQYFPSKGHPGLTYYGGGGSEYYAIVLQNIGRTPCTLDGFPGVSFLDANKQPMGSPAVRKGPPGQPVILQPNQSGSSQLVTASDACSSGGSNPESTYVTIFPPNQTVSLTVRAKVVVCEPTIYAFLPGLTIRSVGTDG